jgi:hypothetical protein
MNRLGKSKMRIGRYKMTDEQVEKLNQVREWLQGISTRSEVWDTDGTGSEISSETCMVMCLELVSELMKDSPSFVLGYLESMKSDGPVEALETVCKWMRENVKV